MKEKHIPMVACTGLLVGSIFGMIGSFAASPAFRALAWGVDGIALIVAAALLTIYFFRNEQDLAAAAFLIFAIGQSLVVSCSGAELDKDISSFGAGIGLWAASLLVTGSLKLFPAVVRISGMIAAVLFLIAGFQIFMGKPINALTKPLPFLAYPVFVLTMFGWVWTLLKQRAK